MQTSATFKLRMFAPLPIVMAPFHRDMFGLLVALQRAQALPLLSEQQFAPTRIYVLLILTLLLSLPLINHWDKGMNLCGHAWIRSVVQMEYAIGLGSGYTIANSNGNLVPATSYYWSVYCYPVSTYGTTNNPSAISGTSSNLCGPSINTYAPAVLIWDSGSISFPVVNSENQTLNTNRVCPDSYTPYLTITSSYQWSPGPASQSQTGGGNKATVSATRMYLGHGICVSGLQGTNGGQYTFNYLVNKTYFRMSNFYSSSLYLWSKDSSGVVSAGGYNRPSAGILQPDGTVDGNGNFSSATYQTAPTDVGGIQWTLYCYPQGYTPPSYDTSYCKIGATPF
jgi:hypothetical protein